MSPAPGAGTRHPCSVMLLKMQAPSIPAPAPPASLFGCVSPGSPGSSIYLQFAKASLLPQGGGEAFAPSRDEFVTSPGTRSSSHRAQIILVAPITVAPATPRGRGTPRNCRRGTQHPGTWVSAQPPPGPAPPGSTPCISPSITGGFQGHSRRDRIPEQKLPEVQQKRGAQSGARLSQIEKSEQGLLFGGLF